MAEMAEEIAPAEAKSAQAAQAAEQAAQVAAAQPRQAAQSADVADDAPEDGPSDRAPRVWLAYNSKSGVRFGHVPTQGSGAHGELTPAETQAYFTRADYDQATKADPPMYQRARKADLRPNQPYTGEPLKEAAPHGES